MTTIKQYVSKKLDSLESAVEKNPNLLVLPGAPLLGLRKGNNNKEDYVRSILPAIAIPISGAIATLGIAKATYEIVKPLFE